MNQRGDKHDEEVCDVCGGRPAACRILGHRPENDRPEWRRSAPSATEGITVPLELAEKTEAMFRSVDPRGVIAQRWTDALRNAPRSSTTSATAPTDLYIGGWNDAMQVAADVLRSSADNCLPGSPAEAQNWPFVLEQMARKIEKRKGQPSAPSSTRDTPNAAPQGEKGAVLAGTSPEREGPDSLRPTAVVASTQDIDGRIASSRMSDHRDMAEEAARASAERTTKWDLVADKLSTINGLSDDEYETVNAAAQYLRECGAVHAHARSAPSSKRETAKKQYQALATADMTPLEALRFFCSLSMDDQDWLDVEPFFDDVEKQLSAPASELDINAATDAALQRVAPSVAMDMPRPVAAPEWITCPDTGKQCSDYCDPGKGDRCAKTGLPFAPSATRDTRADEARAILFPNDLSDAYLNLSGVREDIKHGQVDLADLHTVERVMEQLRKASNVLAVDRGSKT